MPVVNLPELIQRAGTGDISAFHKNKHETIIYLFDRKPV
jgi:hypothetical protein